MQMKYFGKKQCYSAQCMSQILGVHNSQINYAFVKFSQLLKIKIHLIMPLFCYSTNS